MANDATSGIDWVAVKRRLAASQESLVDAERLSPQESNELMRARARELARVPEELPDTSEVLEVVSFRLGSEVYAIATKHVLEVTVPDAITPLPFTEPHFIGVTNLRGEVTTLIDLFKFLGIPGTGESDRQVLVIGNDKPEFGVVVDGIDQVMILRRGALLEPASVFGLQRELITGCTSEGLLVFDGDALLQCESLYIDQSDG